MIWDRAELRLHEGHDLEVAVYGAGESVTIECITCGAVLVAGEDLESIMPEGPIDTGSLTFEEFVKRHYAEIMQAEQEERKDLGKG